MEPAYFSHQRSTLLLLVSAIILNNITKILGNAWKRCTSRLNLWELDYFVYLRRMCGMYLLQCSSFLYYFNFFFQFLMYYFLHCFFSSSVFHGSSDWLDCSWIFLPHYSAHVLRKHAWQSSTRTIHFPAAVRGKEIWNNIKIICCHFLPPSRKGGYVKTDYTHTAHTTFTMLTPA